MKNRMEGMNNRERKIGVLLLLIVILGATGIVFLHLNSRDEFGERVYAAIEKIGEGNRFSCTSSIQYGEVQEDYSIAAEYQIEDEAFKIMMSSPDEKRYLVFEDKVLKTIIESGNDELISETASESTNNIICIGIQLIKALSESQTLKEIIEDNPELKKNIESLFSDYRIPFMEDSFDDFDEMIREIQKQIRKNKYLKSCISLKKGKADKKILYDLQISPKLLLTTVIEQLADTSADDETRQLISLLIQFLLHQLPPEIRVFLDFDMNMQIAVSDDDWFSRFELVLSEEGHTIMGFNIELIGTDAPPICIPT